MSLDAYLPTDDFPWTGKKKVSPAVRVKMRDTSHTRFIRHGLEEQGITPGKVYEVDEVEGFGDAADVHIKETDIGSPGWFMDCIFEDVD